MNSTFVLLMVMEIIIGVYCAHKCGPNRPLWVRLIILSPALTSLLTIFELMDAMRLGGHIYSVYLPDIARALSTLAIYTLVASRFSSHPWLDIQNTKRDE